MAVGFRVFVEIFLRNCDPYFLPITHAKQIAIARAINADRARRSTYLRPCKNLSRPGADFGDIPALRREVWKGKSFNSDLILFKKTGNSRAVN